MQSNIHFINNTTDYLDVLHRIKDASVFFLDTEFIREKTYRPIVALIQIAIDDKDAYLIDPTFEGFDGVPLFDILKDSTKKIILHSARQDLEIFYYHYGFTPHDLVDTQIIAAALGYGDQVSFESLVKTITTDSIDKSQQRTNWLKRPLSESQMKYAACDVLYLAKIYPFLESALTSQMRWSWIDDDIKNLCDPNIFTVNTHSLLKKIRHGLTSKKAIQALHALAVLREDIAIEQDLIRTLVCPDSILITLAEKRPKTLEALQKLKNLKHNFVFEYQDAIFDTLTKADDIIEVPVLVDRPDRLTHSQEKLINILSVAADATANNNSVARRLFATHSDIVDFVRTQEAPFLSGWRYDLFGCVVNDILQGDKGLFYKQGQIIVE
jgi:ribonuclease D